MFALVMKVEEVTQRVRINISEKESKLLYIGIEVSDVRVGVEDVRQRGQAMKEVVEFTYL